MHSIFLGQTLTAFSQRAAVISSSSGPVIFSPYWQDFSVTIFAERSMTSTVQCLRPMYSPMTQGDRGESSRRRGIRPEIPEWESVDGVSLTSPAQIRSPVILEMDILDSPVAAVMLALERGPPVAIICKTRRRFSYFIFWAFPHSRFAMSMLPSDVRDMLILAYAASIVHAKSASSQNHAEEAE